MRKEFKIPTLLGLFLLLVSIGAVIFVVERGTSLLSRAGESSTPKEISVVNVTDDSFAVSWVTATPTKGAIRYHEQVSLSTPQVAYDIRDIAGNTALRYTHFVTVSGLTPETRYKIEIVGHKNKTSSYLATTGTPLSAPPHVVNPTYGSLYDQDNRSVKEALVYTSFPGSQTLGSIVDPDGSWVIALGGLRTEDGARYFIPTRQDTETLSFVTSSGRTNIRTTIDENSPLRPIRLDSTHSFTSFKNDSAGPLIAQSQEPVSVSDSVSGPFSVTLPKANSSLTSQKPAFKGNGITGKKVVITINGGPAPIVGKTTVTESGTWSWTPPTLSPNPYIATLVSFTLDETPLALSIPFTILKSGTSVLQAATPSASLLPSPNPSPSNQASPGIGGGPTPRPSASSSPRVTPLASAIATGSATPSASPMPVTGTTEPTWILLWGGMAIIVLGMRGLLANTESKDSFTP